jgi:ABC-type polysaccharide/polyol phosphate export permease
VMDFNPMANYIGAVREALLHGTVSLNWQLATLFAGSVALFIFSRFVFRRLSPHFEDFL